MFHKINILSADIYLGTAKKWVQY